MVEKICPRCIELSEGVLEAMKAIKHCQRTLDVIVNNQNNPRIVVQCAIDTEVYLQVTMNQLRAILALGDYSRSDMPT